MMKEGLTAFLGVILNVGTIQVPDMKRLLQIFWLLNLNENFSRNANVTTRIQKMNYFVN